MSENKSLVFLHGLFGSLSDEVLLSEYGDRQVFAPDLLGYGENRAHDISSVSLLDQAEHVLTYMDKNSIERPTLVGHSVGGAVAALLAMNHPERIDSLISVEGNMTPPDAFWSASLAEKSVDEIQMIVDSYYADVAAWISGAGVQATPVNVRIATAWLDHQPASTLKAQAHAVVEATSDDSGFIKHLTARLAQGLELHLIAGSDSREGWHVPSIVETAAKTMTIIPEAGHLMMLQSPSNFAETIKRLID